MKSIISIILLIFILLFVNQKVFSDIIIVDSIERTYLVHLPKSYDKNAFLPLVIVLHGCGGKAENTDKLTGFDRVSDKYSFIVVYPNGIDNDGREKVKKYVDGKEVNDVKFISCLIDSLRIKYSIDSNRVFVTGISNGGIMSFRLACELSDKIAGIAPVAASMSEIVYNYCKPSRPVPVMIIFGDSDPLVPFEGGDIIVFGKRGKVVSVDQSVKFWIKNNGCTDKPIETIIVDSTDDDTRAIRYTYKGNSDVVYWLIQGGGHIWPGGWHYLPSFIIGKTSEEIDASEEIWKFFNSIK